MEALYKSFYSIDFYRKVAQEWKGICLLYLFFFVSSIWIALGINTTCFFSKDMPTELVEIINQLPTIKVKSGDLSIDKPCPYTIIDPSTKSPLIVIDTTGKIKSIDDIKANMLVTKEQVTVRKNKYETRTFDLDEISDFEVTSKEIIDFIKLIIKWGIPVAFLVSLPFVFIGHVLMSLFYSLFALMFNAFLKAHLQYSALLRLSVIAMTPIMLLSALKDLALASMLPKQVAHMFPLFSFIVTLSYCGFAVNANKFQGKLAPADLKAIHFPPVESQDENSAE